MRSIITVLCMLLFLQCTSKRKETSFDMAVREIFFGGQVTDKFEKQMDHFHSVSQLRFDTTAMGYTLYPPLSALGQGDGQLIRLFRFKEHPYLKFAFNEGKVELTHPLKKGLRYDCRTSMMLKFESEAEAIIAYGQLAALLTPLATRHATTGDSLTASEVFIHDQATVANNVVLIKGHDPVQRDIHTVYILAGNEENAE